MSTKRIEAIQSRMRTDKLDALIVASPYNRRWLSGFTGSAGTVVVAKERAYLLVDFRYIEQAKQQSPDFEVCKVGNVNKALQELLLDIGARRVGFESNHVVFQAWQNMQEALGEDIDLIPTENWLEKARGIKDSVELESLAKAASIADTAFERLLPAIKPGVSENAIALELEFLLRRNGAERMAFPPIVVSGERTSMPHGQPSERVLTEGDLVTLDFGAVWKGYCSDMTRTVALGQISEALKRIYDLVLQAQLAGVEAVRARVEGRAVDAVSRNIIRAAGYGEHFGHGLGHGVGLEVHEEFPRLNATSELALEPGMVCSVEPGIYVPGLGGVRIEDLVVVKEGRCQVLSGSPKELLILGA